MPPRPGEWKPPGITRKNAKGAGYEAAGIKSGFCTVHRHSSQRRTPHPLRNLLQLSVSLLSTAENRERSSPARANAVRLAARLHCPKRQPSYATYFAEATKVKKATADRQADGTHRPAALRFRTPGLRLKPRHR